MKLIRKDAKRVLKALRDGGRIDQTGFHSGSLRTKHGDQIARVAVHLIAEMERDGLIGGMESTDLGPTRYVITQKGREEVSG